MDDASTIVACASGSARSRTALIRCCGAAIAPLCRHVLRDHTNQAHAWSEAGSLPTNLRWIGDCSFLLGGMLVPIRAIALAAPRTFTGQDTLELLVPGNPLLVSRMCAELCSTHPCGPHLVRMAEPGEFAARAYAHGKLTLPQAEALAATIAATTDHELRAAARVLTGQSQAQFEALASELASILALVEAGIDFADQEDVVAITAASLRSRTFALCTALRSALGTTASSSLHHATPHVVLTGAPSAGKSTLMNALLGWQRALTDAAPGTTRDALAEELMLRSASGGREATIRLIDLPGTDGHTSDADSAAIAARALHDADVILHIIAAEVDSDFPRRAQTTRASVRAGLDSSADKPTITVISKADLLAPSAQASIAERGWCAICALDGSGLANLRRTLLDLIWARGGHGDSLLPRHARAISSAADELAQLLTTEPLLADERTAAGLRSALDALGELTGRMERDAVLGRIFAGFCIGK